MMRLSLPRYMRWLLLIAWVFLLFMTVGRLALFFYFEGSGQSFLGSLPAFWLGIRYDLRDVAFLFVFLLILGAVPIFNPYTGRWGKSTWMATLAIAAVLFTILYTVDFGHYAYLSERLNASLLGYMGDSRTSWGMVWQTYPVVRVVLWVVLFSAFLWGIMRWGYRWVERPQKREPLPPGRAVRRGVAWAWGLLLLAMGALAVFGRAGIVPLRWSDAFRLRDQRMAQIALNPFQSFFSSLKNPRVSADDAAAYYPEMARYLGLPDSALAGNLRGDGGGQLDYTRIVAGRPDSAGDRPNVILVICESFSGYKSSMWGNPLNTTPFFDSLSRQGVFFNHCFTPHYGTARGVWAVVTGIPDVVLDNTASRGTFALNQHCILDDLEGYSKYYFVGGDAGWANLRNVLKDNVDGLHIYEGKDFPESGINVWGISDKDLFLEATKTLSRQQGPFFAIIQTSDNHRPYTIPAGFHAVTYPKDTLFKYGFRSNEELNSFRYTDFCYRAFMRSAEASPFFKNTIFVFVGDHGIRGDAGEMMPKAWTENGLTAFHVPLLFYAPDILKPAVHTANCSQIDVVPTIAGLTGAPYTNTTLGRDLLDGSDSSTNTSFIIDQDNRQIGVIEDGMYYYRGIFSTQENFVSILDNRMPSATALFNGATADSLRARMRADAEGFYQTARYLLTHNPRVHRF